MPDESTGMRRVMSYIPISHKRSMIPMDLDDQSDMRLNQITSENTTRKPIRKTTGESKLKKLKIENR